MNDNENEISLDAMKMFVAIEENIEKYGHTVIATYTSMTNMAYTVGLTDKGLSEIVVFGLPEQSAHIVLNDSAQLAMENKLFLDVPNRLLANFPLIFKRVPPEAGVGYVNIANARAEHPVKLIQLVWPDEKGLFPWEDGFNEKFKEYQPLLFNVN